MNPQGETALHVVSRGRYDSQDGARVAQLLLEHGVDVNAIDKVYDSPLHSASYGEFRHHSTQPTRAVRGTSTFSRLVFWVLVLHPRLDSYSSAPSELQARLSSIAGALAQLRGAQALVNLGPWPMLQLGVALASFGFRATAWDIYIIKKQNDL